MRKSFIFSILIIFAGILSGCGEYQRVIKSTDPNVKYEYAKRLYDQGKYAQSASILQEIVSIFKGQEKAEETLYMLGMCNYHTKDYLNSGAYLSTYYKRYPKGKYVEDARYYCGRGYYLDSPDPQLDQSATVRAIEELTNFLELYPTNPRVPEAQAAIFDLQDKLALKQLQNAQLYYNLGTYLGNNYESAVIVAQNALKAYPYAKYKEQLEMLVLKSRFQEAENSVAEKKAERYATVIDEYFSFINNYPESSYRSEADNIYKIATKHVTND